MDALALHPRTAAMHSFVSHLQVLAGDLIDADSRDIIDRFDRLTDSIPDPTSRLEQLAIGELLRQALIRLHAAVRCELAANELSHVDAQVFRDCVARLRLMQDPAKTGHLAEFQRILAVRYVEAGLTAGKVAAVMDLSVSSLIRVLQRETGHGFPWHLRRARLMKAQELLLRSMCSIKEISGRVGYKHASQFDRHFKTGHGVTPLTYRRLRTTSDASLLGRNR